MASSSLIFWPALLAFAIVLVLTWLLTDVRRGRGFLLDHPNERSLHRRPTSRAGGLAITAGIFAAGIGLSALVSLPVFFPWLATAAAIVVVISFVDDLSHVNKGVRIAFHIAAAVCLLYGGLGLEAVVLPGMSLTLSAPLLALIGGLYVVWLLNVYNFMDGMDGMAAGMAVIGFGTFSLLGFLAGNSVFTAAALLVAGAAGGFLVFNFPPARIFMGDVGSSLLGLLVAGFSLWADVAGVFPLWASVVVFSPFIVDATLTLIRRMMRREPIWTSHKSHFYQRLVELGWGHRRTLLWEYALMVLCAASAIVALALGPTYQWWLLGFWTVTYAILVALVRALEDRQRSGETVQSL